MRMLDPGGPRKQIALLCAGYLLAGALIGYGLALLIILEWI